MLANKHEAETLTKHVSCDSKWKFNSTTRNSDQKWNNETCQCECKNFRKCKKDYSWNPSTCICEISKYLKSIADTSVIGCDKMISLIDIVATKTKMTNTIKTNVTKSCHSKEIRDCFISDHITIDNCHYLLSLCKTKKHWCYDHIKWKIMN